MDQVFVVLVTVGSQEEGMHIARALVEERLAACVNMIPTVRSIYSWQGQVCDDPEVLLVIKTRQAVFAQLEARIKELHSYEVAEIIALPVTAGSEDYLQWVLECTSHGAA
ncbi:divalent cation tolerance protein [Desulfacinum hydrothermale DSM 13146]|uniref:Divalent cation tolerance protein n=1 Tax=Desulfacinum hydrothermale DSM 13146 TaxID=1121390 RepID=A0A1W1X5I4_9BACT|nr:divalent-cation tolerance protein CutA [Desulfacinum hydrothermale]SMC19172.1 divalent cation tolerance protein [Desulfacinum hydrothermale DSM 13146]